MSRPPRRPRRPRRVTSPDVPASGVSYPFVAIIGRPNVGKSTLFNRLVGQRLAITEATAGTTRDRVASLVTLPNGRKVELCDMGGIGGTGDPHDKEVNRQIDMAMEYADAVLLVVDTRAGLHPVDEAIARRVQKLGRPVIVVANKAETQELELSANEFYAFGFESELAITSAREGTGKTEVLERLGELFPLEQLGAEEAEAAGEEVLRLAIVGRRNVGKSTYVNALFGSDRVIASEEAGTTRDAVDVRVEVNGRPVVLIDTAGLRKRGKADDHIEIIAHGRAQEALRRCDVALLLLDCVDDVVQVDKKIMGLLQKEHKAAVLVANKWDLVGERMSPEDYADYVSSKLPGLQFAPLVCISALRGTRETKPIELAFQLHAQSMERVGTGVLNRILAGAIERRRPRPYRGRLGKIYFGTQVGTNPVTLLLFCNDPKLFDAGYRRYLAGQLREHTPWREVPVRLAFRPRDSARKGGGEVGRQLQGLQALADQPHWVEQGAPEIDVLADAIETSESRKFLEDVFAEGAEDDEPAEGWDLELDGGEAVDASSL
ncbi:MAG: ribosome biogenesis GTPase Der [Planctomycetes bacterium]|nr:ribosome biogenesis GTPase Der [Planctomycetota bacterium]